MGYCRFCPRCCGTRTLCKRSLSIPSLHQQIGIFCPNCLVGYLVQPECCCPLLYFPDFFPYHLHLRQVPAAETVNGPAAMGSAKGRRANRVQSKSVGAPVIVLAAGLIRLEFSRLTTASPPNAATMVNVDAAPAPNGPLSASAVRANPDSKKISFPVVQATATVWEAAEVSKHRECVISRPPVAAPGNVRVVSARWSTARMEIAVTRVRWKLPDVPVIVNAVAAALPARVQAVPV